MTTITFEIEQKVNISKTHFYDLEELSNYLKKEIKRKEEDDLDVDFRELDNSEVSLNLLNKINETKKIPKHLLYNI